MLLLDRLGHGLARYLSKELPGATRLASCTHASLASTLKRGDVLLVEGNTRFSSAIKFITQSTWSHAALYIGHAIDGEDKGDLARVLLEADINVGVRAVPLSYYSLYHTRICRPIGLSGDEINAVINFATDRIGHQYDLKNIIDLARFLIQSPPVPHQWRRRLLALGSGDPTRAICSSLIAQAFQSIPYPILPDIIYEELQDPHTNKAYYDEIIHIRHHSLFTPRDFDISPYFQIIKPTLALGFNPHMVKWGHDYHLE